MAMADKKSRRELLYGKKDDAKKPDEGEEKKASDTAKMANADPKDSGAGKTESMPGKDAAPMTAPEGDAGNPGDTFMSALQGLNKQQEAERRDTHGNHREALRMMAQRHDKQIKDLIGDHFSENEPGDGAGADDQTADAE